QKSVEERHEALLGFAIGAIRISKMVDAAIDATGPAPAVSLRLIDETPRSAERVLYARNWSNRAELGQRSSRDFVHATSFEIAGGAWTLELVRLFDHSVRPQDALPWGVALITLLLT